MTATTQAKRMRGIYLLPNLFTMAAMFSGFYAIVAGLHGFYEDAVIAIYVAAVFDSLDGRVARLTQSQTEFGAQLDSLSDMLCFGLAPALLMYCWSLDAMGKAGWLAAFLYAACTALRLARFNTQLSVPNKRYFQGLPTPAAAGFIISLIWVAVHYGINGHVLALPMSFMAVLVALFKVSTFRYRSFKDFDLRSSVPFVLILSLVLILLIIAVNPPVTLALIGLVYVASGPVTSLIGFQQRRRQRLARRKTKHD